MSDPVGLPNPCFIRVHMWHRILPALEKVKIVDTSSWVHQICRKAGKRAPASDLLILACARNHDVELKSADAHFDFLKTL